ncbi:O-methyltransferase involved in polyketide biosynthesis [Methanohalophilus levihalophilus]|uniref:class I SAM-dependent methyltransferase n=1 Tax=Methanohalophilus levihalophilus TaxID=1431282 RepID=UPI001AE5638E|nr:class I SAM-dependent methyltransferase [Methanohalophilus levihalophilus]MBP2029095.1 O-methyltransferase involved in polyketide biosynthesis [Methanohalophilus levihalophilus]
MSLPELREVSMTSLLTLYCHAIESQSREPILEDEKAVEITSLLDRELSDSRDALAQVLVQRKIKKQMFIHIAIRAKKYDKYVTDFLQQNPSGVVVNIGCGLDSRFLRIDNGKVIFYDLDFPELISLKKRFFEETGRYRFIPSSVLDFEWIVQLKNEKGPFLFVAEGVFMYLPQKDVKALVLKLRSEFPDSELVCEVFNSFWLQKPFKKIVNFKMQKQLHLGKDAEFLSGIRSSNEMQQWGCGIELLDDWSYFDSNEKKLGWLKLLRNFGFIRKTQWTVHYRLGGCKHP